MMPMAKRAKERATNRPQRLRCLRRVGDVSDAVRVQRGGDGDKDEPADGVRHEHADAGVDSNAPHLRRCRQGCQHQRLGAQIDAAALGLLRRLPEEEVGADRGTEDGDDADDIVDVQGERRHEGRAHDLRPRHADHEGGGDIGEERQCRPAEVSGVAPVCQEDLEPGAEGAECHDIDETRAADQQAQRIGHRAEIGAEIDGVGDEQQRDQAMQQPGRVVAADIRGDAAAGAAADAGADLLDRRISGKVNSIVQLMAKPNGGAGDQAGILSATAPPRPR